LTISIVVNSTRLNINYFRGENMENEIMGYFNKVPELL
jgi:hypothetical protein